jgi:hypothetical protein
MNLLCPLDTGPARRAQTGHLCDWHRHHLDTLTTEISTLWCELALVLDHSAPHQQTTRRHHPHHGNEPLDLTIAALRDTRSRTTPNDPNPLPPIPYLIATWLLLLAEQRPLSVRRLPTGIVAQLDTLTRHHDWIAARDWIADYHRELEQMRRAMRRAINDRAGHPIGRCDLPAPGRDICGGLLLRTNGTETVHCVNCHATWGTPSSQALLARRLGA